MNKTVVPIKGMHCRSCELLIEDELKNIPGVKKVDVSHKKACAEVYYNNSQLKVEDIDKAVQNAGYQVGFSEKPPIFSAKVDDYMDIIYAAIVLFFLFILVDGLGFSKFFAVNPGHPSNLLTVALIGLTAGFSTCMALIGGIVLGVSARFSQSHLGASAIEKFKPHLFFNLGRIVSYTILGGAIGLLGSFFQFSGTSLGLVTAAVALVMLTLGLQLTGLFPRLKNISFTLPKGISKLLGIKDRSEKEYSHKNSFLMGASTFFLPCGFTQAMQLYAVSTGSFVQGAAIMGIFALGTAPGLLSVGGLTAAIKGTFAQKFFKFAGVVVSLLAFFNLNNGLNLLGTNPFNDLGNRINAYAASDKNSGAKVENGVQVVRMDQTASGYSPNSFTVTVGIPVRWIINSKDPNTCASSIVSSKLNVRQSLHPGENIIEFTPKEVGTIKFSCSMGMYTGSFNVVEKGSNNDQTNNNDVQVLAANTAPTLGQPAANGSCGSGGGGCGCGGGKAQAAKVGVEVTPIPAKNENGIQILKTVYTSDADISPYEFTVKAGKPVRMEVDVKDEGSGCMSTIYIPELTDNPQFLEKGKTLVFEFTPDKPGKYPITCAMGVPRGTITVI